MKFLEVEKWVEFSLGYNSQLRYAISNFGNLCSFENDINKRRLLKGSFTEGYNIFRYKIYVGEVGKKKIRHKHLFFHKLVATYFLPKESDDQVFVLHLDHDKSNNVYYNLKWATKEEMIAHNRTSPAVIKAKQNLVAFNINRKGHKLTTANVQYLKARLLDPNRKTRLRMLAKQFGVTEMTLQRIKTGENWRHVEPLEKS